MRGKRVQREIKTINKMIKLYENSHPASIEQPNLYQDLYTYAVKRLDKCRYGENKPACKQCPVHCYQPKMREQMKRIMHWWIKMIIFHPILAIKHLIDDKKPVPELPVRRKNN